VGDYVPPKVDGGLGLRRMETMNKAFIMKLAWGIIQDSRSLWVRVLKAKYMKHLDQVDQVHAKGKDSSLWKEICKVWPQVTQGLNWARGSGRNVRFWRDSWLEGYGPLLSLATQDIPEDLVNCSVVDMLEDDKHWKWDSFAYLLHVQVVMLLAGYPPPSQNMEQLLTRLF
jgi:hypothetical protein